MNRLFSIYLLNKLVVFEDFSALHDSDDGRLEVHLPVLIDGMVGLLHLLRCLTLNRAGDAELGALVAVLQIQ